MITEHDIQEAIAECEGVRNPTVNTCMKLASFYTIQEHMLKKDREKDTTNNYHYDNNVSYASGLISFNGKSEFAQLIDGQDEQKILQVVNELVEIIQVLNPRLYNTFIEKLKR